MDFSSNRNTTTSKWRKRQSSILKTYKIPFLLFTSLILIAFFLFPKPIFPKSSHLSQTCNKFNEEKLLFFAPHSGFSNQLQEFKNAILLAAILNRTLVLPPVLDHHSVALGSCPKFRVLEPNELRFKVWNHSLELLRDQRYVSMADVIDISSLESTSDVKFIDFRVFASMWCGVNLDLACAAGSSSQSSLLEKLKQCGSLLSGYDNSVNTCTYHSQEDCRTTVWTYQKDEDGVLDSFQADEELKKKKKISFVRMRKDIYKTFGPGSEAGHTTVLSFGSLFTAPYKGSESHIDIHDAPKDKRIQLLIQKIEFLPFVPEILNAGKKFAVQIIGAQFLCVQLRLLDGQFKNHQEATFRGMKQKLDLLKETASTPIHIFVMTDLPKANWTGSYLGKLEKESDAYRLFTLREDDELVAQTTKQLVKAGRSLKFQSASMKFDRREQQCKAQSLPDMLLYLEETICSCASLGFVGTSGSTISESIELMRINKVCTI